MPDPKQLPYLVRLLEDDDPFVVDRVLEELASYGENLDTELRKLPDPLGTDEIRVIDALVSRHRGDDDGDSGQAAPEESSTTPDRPFVERRLLFEPGTLVRHRRYGYRGVIVSADLSCQASKSWYENNRSRPPRNQPWYHVLVHGRETVTYGAQTSLVRDTAGERIDHPLVKVFFDRFADGGYQRNNRPWPTSGG